jgi:hypothetical protein
MGMIGPGSAERAALTGGNGQTQEQTGSQQKLGSGGGHGHDDVVKDAEIEEDA